MSELLKEEKYVLKLGDKDYELSPLSWGMMSEIESEFDASMATILEGLNKTPYKTTLKLTSVFLKPHNVPKETIESLVSNNDIKNITNVIAKIMTDFYKVE